MNGLTGEVIAVHPFFSGLRLKHLRILAECAKKATFGPEETLFREGEPANQFYLIQKGRLVLTAGEPAQSWKIIDTLGPGDVMGWSWMFPPFRWHFTARTVEPVVAIELNAGHLLEAAETDHDFGYELMKRVAQLVIHRLQAARKQFLGKECAPHDAPGLLPGNLA